LGAFSRTKRSTWCAALRLLGLPTHPAPLVLTRSVDVRVCVMMLVTDRGWMQAARAPHELTNCLMRFLHQLAEPLLTQEHAKNFYHAVGRQESRAFQSPGRRGGKQRPPWLQKPMPTRKRAPKP
jgi:hypothetical protein